MSAVLFDSEEGVLRLSHTALSVLARLAVDPVDPALVDHAVAEPLAALRRSGVIGPAGVHPAVAPLARAVGRAHQTLELTVADRSDTRVHHGWLASDLLVFAVPAGDAFDLVSDEPGAVADLVGELAGLQPIAGAETTASLLVDGDGLDTLVRRGAGATEADVRAVAAHPPVGELAAAVAAMVNAVQSQWRLTVHARARTRLLEVYDAGPDGLWLAEPADDPLLEDRLLSVCGVSAARVRQRVRELVGVSVG